MMSAQHITLALKGKWFGSYGFVCCVVHDDHNPSLLVRDGNEPGRLLVRCYAGCHSSAVIHEFRRRGLHAGAAAVCEGHSDSHANGRQAEEHQRRQRRRAALAIWHDATTAAGTLVQDYLQSRGITAPVPVSLRYHPALKHGPTGRLLPAMVAGVQLSDRAIAGVHRTYLATDGRAKAAVTDAKVSLGPISTGAVRLARAGPELAIAEGIETGLSFMQATGIPTWAALSTSGMRAIVLPPLPAAALVYLAVDIDPNGAGEQAAEAAAARFAREGRKVKIARPADGSKDFNDSLRSTSTS